ncbi:hypothetical protein AAFX24_17520 [Vibrio mediterranei]|uniref:hypothetical protein n=1 Tax=Vibrio mediterranei TaxID=689 RepID=UPI0038CE1F90
MKKSIIGIILGSVCLVPTVLAKMTLEEAMRQNEPYMNKQYTGRNATEGLDPGDFENPGSSSSGKPIVFNGSSGSSCTNVRPPSGTSVSTHDVYINGVYEDQTDHERSHTRGVAQQITHDGDTRICAAWTHARHYSFVYQIKAYKR